MTVQELYWKIKEQYPDWEPPKAVENDFSVPEKPPFTEEQLDLMEAGFKVEPNYDPRHYPDSKINKEHFEDMKQRFLEDIRTDYAESLYQEPKT